MKRILYFTCEAGGAEALIPIIKNMENDRNYEVTVLGYGYASDRFNKQGIDFINIDPISRDDFSIFEIYKPDAIVTSATSLPLKDMSEKYLWQNAKKENIHTIAFLDQWQNYAIRFSGISHSEYLKYQPDLINCINDIGRKEMINEGFDDKKLIELGHPYLATLKSIAFDKISIFNKIGILNVDKQIVVFVSEAIEENYGNSRGYTQYETLEFLLSQDFLSDKFVIVKLHPKDNIEKFKEFKNVLFVQNELTSLDIISVADFVIGMTSIMLIEGYILGKNTLSIQLNSFEDLLLLSKYNFINKITLNNQHIRSVDFISNGILSCDFNYDKFINVL